jgi:histidine triad (HIT) family protein
MAYDPDNIFARILRGEIPAYRVYEDADTLAFLDVMPQADGHVLVLPKAAAENLFDLDPAAAGAVIRTVQKVARAARDAFRADGVTIMQFNGPAAGQTVFHYHVHIVPRVEGQPLRSHGRGMADAKLLEEHAARLRAALGH